MFSILSLLTLSRDLRQNFSRLELDAISRSLTIVAAYLKSRGQSTLQLLYVDGRHVEWIFYAVPPTLFYTFQDAQFLPSGPTRLEALHPHMPARTLRSQYPNRAERHFIAVLGQCSPAG
jgi:hypothetical protein